MSTLAQDLSLLLSNRFQQAVGCRDNGDNTMSITISHANARLLATPVAVPMLERRIVELEASLAQFQAHNTELVLRRQAAEEGIRTLSAELVAQGELHLVEVSEARAEVRIAMQAEIDRLYKLIRVMSPPLFEGTCCPDCGTMGGYRHTKACKYWQKEAERGQGLTTT